MDYNSLNNKAKRLIQDYGAALTLKRQLTGTTATSFSPTLGSYASVTYTNYSVYGVIRSPGREYAGDRFYGDVQIQTGDREVIIATQVTVSPLVGDLITIAGIDYRIIVSFPVSPATTTLLFKTLCRR